MDQFSTQNCASLECSDWPAVISMLQLRENFYIVGRIQFFVPLGLESHFHVLSFNWVSSSETCLLESAWIPLKKLPPLSEPNTN